MNKINSTGVYENISNLHDESGKANGTKVELVITFRGWIRKNGSETPRKGEKE